MLILYYKVSLYVLNFLSIEETDDCWSILSLFYCFSSILSYFDNVNIAQLQTYSYVIVNVTLGLKSIKEYVFVNVTHCNFYDDIIYKAASLSEAPDDLFLSYCQYDKSLDSVVFIILSQYFEMRYSFVLRLVALLDRIHFSLWNSCRCYHFALQD